MALIVLPLYFSEAQQPDPFDQADASLNTEYQRALARYPYSSQETLRKAERAWIDFSNKNEALLNSLRQESLISEDEDDRRQLLEVKNRTMHLMMFFLKSGIPRYDSNEMLRVQEDRLTASYQKCMAGLGAGDQILLRDAERAWILYRDLDADALSVDFQQPAWTTASRAWLALCRADELGSLLSSQVSSPSPPVASETPPAAFDDTVQIAAWQKDAKDVVADLLAKKADPFFGPVTDFKNVPSVPGDSTTKINDAYETLATLRQNEASHGQHVVSIGLDPASNDAAVITLLRSWIIFESLLKSGNLDRAYSVLTPAFFYKPKVVPPEYASIWNKLSAWKVVIDQTVLPFRDHLTKASNFADLGKSSAAIHEYEAAYSIFQDPQIPEKIKKIREQSLGL